MPLGKCQRCHGSGRMEHPLMRAAGTVVCEVCRGTGEVPTGYGNPSGIIWTPEGTYLTEPETEEIRMGYGLAGQVPVPKHRPIHVTFGVAEGPSLGHTYTFEIPVGDVIVTYCGVPIEEHDLDNTLYMGRLDRAISVTARRDE